MVSLPHPSTQTQPTLYLIRHGQAEHNVPPYPVSHRDTLLTEHGRTQASSIRTAFSESSARRIGSIISSPLRRALQTALIGFEDIIAPTGKCVEADTSTKLPLQVIALPEAQEFSDAPCDTGLPAADLVAEFEAPASQWEGCVDLSLLPPEWGSPKTGKWAPDEAAVEKRAREARQWLRGRIIELQERSEPEESGVDCALVSHGHFLHVLTENWEGFDPAIGTAWGNTEIRAYRFIAGIESTTDDNATIKETDESRRRRLEGGLL